MLKAVSSITNALGALNYKGTWNALTNSPALADGSGTKGDYYVTSTAGTQTFGGIQLFFGVGDWIAYNGAVWQRVDGGSDGNFANVTLTSTDAGATASPLLDLFRDSASPAANDTLGEVEFNGKDSAGNKQGYGVIHGSILSATSGAESGQIHFETATVGVLTEKMRIGTVGLAINDIAADFDLRVEGTADANLLYTDASTNRVGVGTASPAAKLEVAGNIIASSETISTQLTLGGVVAAGVSAGMALRTGSTKTAWLVGAQFNINDAFEITPSTAAGGAVFNNPAFSIASSGIVTMSAYGAGAATFSAAGVISSVSDETWKIKDGVPSNPVAMLKKLEPGYWYYNDEKKEIFGVDRQLGFYAQNVNAAIGPEAAPEPETITTTLEDGTETTTRKTWGYYDRSVLAITVLSLQQALATIESLTARIAELEKA